MKHLVAAVLATAVLSASSFAETPERTGQTTMGGTPVVLLGTPVAVGDVSDLSHEPDYDKALAAAKAASAR